MLSPENRRSVGGRHGTARCESPSYPPALPVYSLTTIPNCQIKGSVGDFLGGELQGTSEGWRGQGLCNEDSPGNEALTGYLH